MNCIDTFRRIEKKYLLSYEEYLSIMKYINKYMNEDEWGASTILNVYYDSDEDDLVKNSLSSPIYKDKIRLRAYGIPRSNSKVFLEIKRKYEDLVIKRRISMSLKEFNAYLKNRKLPFNSQIMKEIDYLIDYYDVYPKLLLAYDRCAYVDGSLRVTFDNNIRYRREDIDLSLGDCGKKLFDDNMYIMEIKALDAIPAWLVEALSENKIYPISFSKYGKIYEKENGELKYV